MDHETEYWLQIVKGALSRAFLEWKKTISGLILASFVSFAFGETLKMSFFQIFLFFSGVAVLLFVIAMFGQASIRHKEDCERIKELEDKLNSIKEQEENSRKLVESGDLF